MAGFEETGWEEGVKPAETKPESAGIPTVNEEDAAPTPAWIRGDKGAPTEDREGKVTTTGRGTAGVGTAERTGGEPSDRTTDEDPET